MAGDLAVLAGLRATELGNRLRELLARSRFKILVIGVFSIAFWFGIFWVARFSMRHLREMSDRYTVDVLTAMFHIFFFALSLMLVFSNAIISYGSLFKSAETQFLLARPPRVESIFLVKMLESVGFSSWAFLFLATPLIAAYGAVYGQGILFLGVALLFFAAFQFIPAAVGAAIAMLVAAFVPRTRKGLVIAAVAAGATFAALLLVRLSGVRGGWAMDLRLASELFENTRFSENPLVPSSWIMRGLGYLRQGRMQDAMFYLGLTASTGAFFTAVAHAMSAALMRRGWYQSQDLPDRKRWAIHRVVDFVFSRLLFFTAPSVRLIVIKDVKGFIRDPAQWSQFLIFFGLLAIYFASLRTFSYDERDNFWKNLHAQLNLMATSLTLATFSSRFIYPQLSLEGRRFWIIGMAPMRREEILHGKLALSFTCSLILSESLIALSGWMLGTPLALAVLHAISLFGICLGLSGLSVGLGALYPNFAEDNPSKIVAGFGGTLNLVLSLAFVTAVMLIQAVPCWMYFGRGLWGAADFRYWLVVSMSGIAALSLAACLVPLHLGLRNVRNLEI